jgi:lysophospholipase L1-like esterase
MLSATGSLVILVYGDSLTWGRNPENRERHAKADRWPSVLQDELGGEVSVIAEGLPGRTTIFDDLTGSVDKNGSRCLPVLLATHEPLDLIVLMLGSNDLKPAICGSVAGVAVGLERLVNIIRSFAFQTRNTVPEILLVSPPVFCVTASGEGPRAGRNVAESLKLAPAISAICERLDCLFLDAAQVATSSPIDGVHLDVANTRAIGSAVARLLRDRQAAAVDSEINLRTTLVRSDTSMEAQA